jgi:hypothetical protein
VIHLEMKKASPARLTLGPREKPSIALDENGLSFKETPTNSGSVEVVNIPGGPHDLSVSLTGTAPVSFLSFTLPAYPDTLRCSALNGRGRVLGRVESIANTYVNSGKVFPNVKGGVLKLTGLAPDGSWKVEWWDTDQGVEKGRQNVTVSGGAVDVPMPPVAADLAFKAYAVGVGPAVKKQKKIRLIILGFPALKGVDLVRQ